MEAAELRIHPLHAWSDPHQEGLSALGERQPPRRVTLELLYDSEATLRLVDQELEELWTSLQPEGPSRCGSAGLHLDQLDAGSSTTGLLLTYWEIQDALEVIRDSRAALAPSLAAPEAPRDDEQAGMSRALALLDTLHGEGEEAGPHVQQLHTRLRVELLALARHMHQREERDECLHHTAAALRELEARLAQLSLLLDGTRASVA